MVISGKLTNLYQRMKLVGSLVEWLMIIHQSLSGFLGRIKIRAYFHVEDMGLVWFRKEGGLKG
jgi:hypothetical protein